MSLTRNLPGASKPTGGEEDGDGGSCSSGCHASLMLTLVSSLLGRLREKKKKEGYSVSFYVYANAVDAKREVIGSQSKGKGGAVLSLTKNLVS